MAGKDGTEISLSETVGIFSIVIRLAAAKAALEKALRLAFSTGLLVLQLPDLLQ